MPRGSSQTSPAAPDAHGDRTRARDGDARPDEPVAWSALTAGAPLAAGTAFYASFGLVDLYMVSRLPDGTRALAALGICEMVPSLASILAYGVANATVAQVARASGADDRAGVRRAVHQSTGVMLALSLLFGLLGLFGSGFVVRDVLGASGEVAALAVDYLQVILVGSYGLFLVMQATSILRAVGATGWAGALMVGGTALNVVLNAILIYGAGPYPEVFAWLAPLAERVGAPRLGVVGSAWGSVIARTIPLLVSIPLLHRRGAGLSWSWRAWRPDRRELSTLASIAWPSSTQLVLRVAMVLFFIAIVNRLFVTPEDPSVMSAYAVCLRFETLALFLALGWGAGAASLLGRDVGAARITRGRRAGWWAAGYAALAAAAVGYAYATWGGAIVGAFDPSPRVVEVGRGYFRVVAWAYVPLSVGAVLAQALSGAGRTVPPLVVDAVLLVGVLVPVALGLAAWAPLEPVDLWWLVAAAHAIPSVVLAVYYRRARLTGREVRTTPPPP